MQSGDVQFCEFELSIGDAIQVGDNLITLLDIDQEDVCFHVESGDAEYEMARVGRQPALPPR